MRKLIALFWIIAALLVSGKALSQANSLRQAETEFSRQNYDKAISHYRKHLRRNPADYDTWNLLAASYYHSGLPDKALKYLRKVAPKVKLKSYNYFYQGLCYDVLKNPEKAKQQFVKASRYQDEWGAKATFELAVLENSRQNRVATLQWLNAYLNQYPQGAFAGKAAQMRDSIHKGNFPAVAEGHAKPDMEKALFRYSPYSLMNFPHYWFWQIGYQYEQGQVNNPGRDNVTGMPTIKTEGFAGHDLYLNAGFGLGPLKTKNALTFIGYHYYQDWAADADRMSTFLKDPGDLEYIPFRPDLLQRYHQLYGYFKRNTNKHTHLGVLGSYEVGRVGSALIPSSEAALRKVLRLSRTSLLMPWFGLRYNDDHESIIYLYLRKELNDEAPEFSNKTYNFLYESSEKTISFGFNHRWRIPSIQTELKAELFRYDYIYNDYWLDFTRTGGLLTGNYAFRSWLEFEAALAIYQDRYALEQIRTNSCSFSPQADVDESTRSIKICPRVDMGQALHLGAVWNISQFQSISGYYSHISNSNKTMKVFERTMDQVYFMYSFAFPSIKRAGPLMRRLSDDEVLKKAY